MASGLVASLYDTYEEARETVLNLQSAGIPTSDITLVARNGETSYAQPVAGAPTSDAVTGISAGASVGAAVGAGAGLLAGLGVVAVPGLGPAVAAGWLAATAVGAVAGAGAGATTGGVVGALVDSGEGVSLADLQHEAARRGGTLVTVRIEERDWQMVEAILRKRRSVDPTRREHTYVVGGWETFDPHLPPEVSSTGPEPRPQHEASVDAPAPPLTRTGS